jgi:hypothetical protein
MYGGKRKDSSALDKMNAQLPNTSNSRNRRPFTLLLSLQIPLFQPSPFANDETTPAPPRRSRMPEAHQKQYSTRLPRAMNTLG